VGFRLTASGGWAGAEQAEDRALPVVDSQPTFPTLTTTAPLNVSTSNVLRVSDAYACVRVLADGISTLPLHVYRRTDAGRVPAGDNAHAVQLLQKPAPGSTGVDLISQIMVHLNVHGEAFVGKWREDREIVQLALLSPETIQVELRGRRIVYLLDTLKGRIEHGPDDVLHIKGMSLDGLRGLSPVTQCRVALGLSSSLQQSAKTFTEQGSKPSGVLSATGQGDALERIQEKWQHRHGGVENHHKVAVVSGEIKWTPVGFSQDDAQFLQQRELSAREVARIFRVPAWVIDAPTGDSLTYANVAERNRALATHSLRPWATRIERAISNDADLCPGGTYVQFDFDGLLRAASEQRAQQYTAALNPQTGWMRREEVRELEDLPPETETAPPMRIGEGDQEAAVA
jgi:HK97 family phage portal protein